MIICGVKFRESEKMRKLAMAVLLLAAQASGAEVPEIDILIEEHRFEPAGLQLLFYAAVVVALMAGTRCLRRPGPVAVSPA